MSTGPTDRQTDRPTNGTDSIGPLAEGGGPKEEKRLEMIVEMMTMT